MRIYPTNLHVGVMGLWEILSRKPFLKFALRVAAK